MMGTKLVSKMCSGPLIRVGNVEIDVDLRLLCSHVHSKHLVIAVCRILQRARITVGWLENRILVQTDAPSVITEVVHLILAVIHRDWTTDTAARAVTHSEVLNQPRMRPTMPRAIKMMPTGNSLHASISVAMARGLGFAAIEVFEKTVLCFHCKIACGEGRRHVKAHNFDNTPRDIDYYCAVCSYALKDKLSELPGVVKVPEADLPRAVSVEPGSRPYALSLIHI